MDKIATLIINGLTLFSKKLDDLALEIRNQKAPKIEVSLKDVKLPEIKMPPVVMPKLPPYPPFPDFPEIKIPEIKVPQPIVNVSPPNITVEPAKVEFPDKMKVEGMEALLEAVNRPEERESIFEEVNSKSPLSVRVVDSKGKAINDFGGAGGGPSVVGIKNTDNSQIDPGTETTLAKIPGLSIPIHDEIVLSYTGSDLTGVEYKLSSVTVATLTLTYVGGNLTRVQKT